MLWFVLTTLAALIWTVVELVDKFIIDQEVRDPVLATAVSGIPRASVFIVASLLFGKMVFEPHLVLYSFAMGSLFTVAVIFYYYGMQREEVSRFSPVLSTTTVFIVVLAFLFLGESFSPVVYLGIFMAVAGSFFISLDDPLKNVRKMTSKVGLLAAITASIVFASREILVKLVTNEISMFSMFFWAGIGGFVVALLMLASRRSELESGLKRGVEHLVLNDLLSVAGFFLFVKAISLGPVSLVSAALKSEYLFVFAGSYLLTMFHPEIIHEGMDRRTAAQKIVSIAVIVGGVTIISIFS